MKTYFSILLLLAVPLLAAGQETSHEYDSTLASQLGADERGMKTYVLVILKTGPADIQDKELRDSLFAGHFSNMDRLAAEKKLVLAGPMGANDNQYRGLFLYDVKSPEEAMELLEGDPTVTSGIFEVELYRWYGSAALPVHLETAKKISKRNP
ncbi:MAG: YciI family protein [Bacteroidales bacterium]|nr:YciI family protein [Bacteroidales bacterium]